MQFIRSGLFHFCFYGFTATALLIAAPPMLLFPGRWAWPLVVLWARFVLFLLHRIVGLSYEIRGLDVIPKETACLIAAKHQSAWETIAFIPFLKHPVYIMKHELTRVPIFGWYAQKMGMIPVQRGTGKKALLSILKAGRRSMERKAQLIIFPEGSRRPVNAPPDYRYGVVRLYQELHVPCVPVALNSGLFWPPAAFLLKPGKVLVEFLPPIFPTLPPYEFKKILVTRIEVATKLLVQEAQEQKHY